MTDRELMQQALDALEEIHPGNMTPMAEESWNKAIEALRARLAQLEQEPVAWLYVVGEVRYVHVNQIDHYYSLDDGETRIKGIPLYTAPPQREWQRLTENEKEIIWDEAVDGREHFCSQYGNFADAIEAKLKEKNSR